VPPRGQEQQGEEAAANKKGNGLDLAIQAIFICSRRSDGEMIYIIYAIAA